jgi:hypothetical protein
MQHSCRPIDYGKNWPTFKTVKILLKLVGLQHDTIVLLKHDLLKHDVIAHSVESCFAISKIF